MYVRDVDHLAAVARELQPSNPHRLRVLPLPRDRTDQHAAARPNSEHAVVAVLAVQKGEKQLLGKRAAFLVVDVQTDQTAVRFLAEMRQQNGVDSVGRLAEKRVIRDVVDDVDRQTHFAESLALLRRRKKPERSASTRSCCCSAGCWHPARFSEGKLDEKWAEVER